MPVEEEQTPASKHVRSLLRGESKYAGECGTVTALTVENFPLLKGLSIKRVVLRPGAAREAHWHANAHELTYCAEGEVLATVIDNKDVVSTFTVEAGSLFFARSGALHSFENLGQADAVLIVAFSHEKPSDFSLHATLGSMTDAVLGNTYGLPAERFAAIRRDTSNPYLVRVAPHAVPAAARFANPHRYELSGQSPPVDHSYGKALVGRSQFFPALENIAMYRIDVPDSGMREVHWHPETAEMGYVYEGHARMTILDPDGTTDTYLLEAGDAYFIPRAYPHQIEVLSEKITFLIFFDQATPGDIGLKLVGAALSRPMLAASLDIAESDLPAFPPIVADPLIVERINPKDPV